MSSKHAVDKKKIAGGQDLWPEWEPSINLKVIYTFYIVLNRNWVSEIYYGKETVMVYLYWVTKYWDDSSITPLKKQNNEIHHFIVLSVWKVDCFLHDKTFWKHCQVTALTST